MQSIDYRLYLVTDDPSRYDGNWLDNVRAAVEGGVTCVQYRDTESAPDIQYRRIRALQDALAGTEAALVVNNDAELARAVGARGVHVGQNDMNPSAVRSIVGPDVEIGLSVTEAGQVSAALRHVRCGEVSCLGIGPVFDATKTKRDASAALGTNGLHFILKMIGPVANCAIGGITLENASEVLEAGAQGLAVVSAFSKSNDPYETARNFSVLLDNCRI